MPDFSARLPDLGGGLFLFFYQTWYTGIVHTKDRFQHINEVLASYSAYDYRPVLKLGDEDEEGGVLEKMINGINALQVAIV